tara:strand:+ start:404 stop:565 length:162 start_codon:yes stop_codon:yes gene_type:complete
VKLTNCKKCKTKCAPVYILSPKSIHSHYVCRDCALKIMKEYYDRRPDEIKKTD